ncbi:MAG: HAMP domain-containing histidine kinase [Chloroflexales bacterium]|nr:HAMP domain-containing histidine kinase [Chloroflexales bacterium]
MATLALQGSEGLTLPAILAQVAQEMAIQMSGICLVRFTPADRETDAHCVVADQQSGARACDGAGGDAAVVALLAQLSPLGAEGEGSLPFRDGQPAVHWAAEHWEQHVTTGAALLLAPLVARGQRIGAIEVVLTPRDTAALARHQRLLRSLAVSAAEVIDRAAQRSQRRSSAAIGADTTMGEDVRPRLALLVHDLRSPLSTLRVSIQMLARQLRDPHELERTTLTRLAEVADAMAEQLDQQIQALTPALAASQSSRGETSPPVELVALTRLTVNFYQQTTSRHELTIDADVKELPGPWSRPHLERILGNLLANAIKYSPVGGEIRVCLGREDDALGSWATLSVRNHGIGITASDLPLLARPGYRARNVGAIPGTGFGLASVREVVEQHGGTLAIQSEMGRSTTVRICLPLG